MNNFSPGSLKLSVLYSQREMKEGGAHTVIFIYTNNWQKYTIHLLTLDGNFDAWFY